MKKSERFILTALFLFLVTTVLVMSGPPTVRNDVMIRGLAPDPVGECDVTFYNEEILSFPTPTSVELTLLPAEASDFYVTYKSPNDLRQQKTTVQSSTGNALLHFTLTGLKSAQEYEYQVHCKTPDDNAFGARKIHTFRTLSHVEDTTFTFGFVPDTHAYTLWATATCGTDTTKLSKLQANIANMISDDLSFVVLGGDWAMITCTPNGCPACTVHGENVSSAGASSQKDADLHYDQIFSPAVLGNLFKETPMVYVLGDHEGEAGYGGNKLLWGKNARLNHLVNAVDVYNGGEDEGRYYSFEVGDLQVVVIDVMRNTLTSPTVADDWTLGPAQLAWLNQTLARSNKQWKFIFAEHLVGGEQGSTSSNFYKGRGSIKATDDNTPRGIYKGEQAIIEQMMIDYGAQIFFSGNDHVASIGEKLNAQGDMTTLHVIGGTSGIGAGWIGIPPYPAEMTWPPYNIPSFSTQIIGTKTPGYFRITLNGKDSALLEYVRAVPNSGSGNGDVHLTYLLEA